MTLATHPHFASECAQQAADQRRNRDVLRTAITDGPYRHLPGAYPILRATEDDPSTFPRSLTPLGLMLHIASQINPAVHGHWAQAWDRNVPLYPGQARWEWSGPDHHEVDDHRVISDCFGISRQQAIRIGANPEARFCVITTILDIVDQNDPDGPVERIRHCCEEIRQATLPVTDRGQPAELAGEIARQTKLRSNLALKQIAQAIQELDAPTAATAGPTTFTGRIESRLALSAESKRHHATPDYHCDPHRVLDHLEAKISRPHGDDSPCQNPRAEVIRGLIYDTPQTCRTALSDV